MACPEWDGRRAIDAANEQGFHGVDLRLNGKNGEVSPEAADSELNALRVYASVKRVVISGLLGYGHYNAERSDPLLHWINTVQKQLEIADALGAHHLRVFAGRPDHISASDHVYRLAEAMATLLANSRSPARVVIQNHGKVSLSIEQAVVLCEALDTDRVALALCPHHARISHPADYLAWIERAAPYAAQLYFSDERSGKTVLPGEGELPWERIIDACGGAEVPRWWTLKYERVWQPDLLPPEISLPSFAAYCRRHAQERAGGDE